MSRRKHKLVDCNPEWRVWNGREGESVDSISFTCPEGHDNCSIHIPFTPASDGTERPVVQHNGAHWKRVGETFQYLTLTPSIKSMRKYKTREEALADGVLPQYYEERMICALHIEITNGEIRFCSDSK